MPTPSLLDEKLRELALFAPTPMPVLSLYLNAQASQHGRDNFEAFLRRYELHVENYHLKHAKEIIESLERIVRKERVEHIILAGDDLILPIIRKELTPFLSSKIVNELKLDITAAEHEVLKATLATMQEHEARTEPERARGMIHEAAQLIASPTRPCPRHPLVKRSDSSRSDLPLG